MDLVPPPSSKRLRGTGTEIGVTMQSEVMQETFELIEQRCVKGDGAFMVVHPKDSPEFGGFIHQLCCRGLPFAPPRIMRREDTGELWSLHQNDIACSGIVLLQAEAIPNRMVPELERLLKEKYRVGFW